MFTLQLKFFNFLGRIILSSFFLYIFSSQGLPKETSIFVLENELLKVSFNSKDASIQVLNKKNNYVWKQEFSRNSYRVSHCESKPEKKLILATIKKGKTKMDLEISIEPGLPEFGMKVDTPGQKYGSIPDYPYPFTLPENKGYYVQNTSGDGLLFKLSEKDKIKKIYAFAGGIPWWGITDLQKGCMTILESWYLAEAGKAEFLDSSVYVFPLNIRYVFLEEGGYISMAKYYRNLFLKRYPKMQTLKEKVKTRKALNHFKDGVYVYFWEDGRDLNLMKQMKDAGIGRCIAMFYGGGQQKKGAEKLTKEFFDGIKKLDWSVGLYRMPSGNLYAVSEDRGWPRKLLYGELNGEKFFRQNKTGWERVCAKFFNPDQKEKLKEKVTQMGVQAFYFDTFIVQLAPCVHPEHPSTLEENKNYRCELLEYTKSLGVAVGSGEGNAPDWAVPHLDYFEGSMLIRSYGDSGTKIPAGDYNKDFGITPEVSKMFFNVDEEHRIPLFELIFHDYVVSSWHWRNTNFQHREIAWRKNLFNILYGTMPYWNMTGEHWKNHRNEFVEGYKTTSSVRSLIGFDEMVSHGWLTDDRKVQYTDWSSGYRIVANFGDEVYKLPSGETVNPHGYTVLKVKNK